MTFNALALNRASKAPLPFKANPFFRNPVKNATWKFYRAFRRVEIGKMPKETLHSASCLLVESIFKQHGLECTKEKTSQKAEQAIKIATPILKTSLVHMKEVMMGKKAGLVYAGLFLAGAVFIAFELAAQGTALGAVLPIAMPIVAAIGFALGFSPAYKSLKKAVRSLRHAEDRIISALMDGKRL